MVFGLETYRQNYRYYGKSQNLKFCLFAFSYFINLYMKIACALELSIKLIHFSESQA